MLNKKDYIYFLLGLVFFSIIIIYSAMIYVKWDNEIENGDDVEINLPIIDWNSYFGLSKQPE
ncbi:MAG: hypothetical protein ACD_51C00053G0008 [uncultured bacterium]|nr:MAG: hypothetical protein ACD_51C00053G0008 [uncultured bacterium]OGJ46874.1 MAG: hypothetical protein A2244_02980 [Candidatus Peregrinibacteria bacterium RIFOXYA2_FULL_41_18]OGJ48008.1 MAG: hypothetical protein A2344_01825 [Candidatus Peregrinibacteria bacterium RIFOXYB12_FULL_41_12]OGJ53258.1 MAG: hypothetical protein A2448_04310 [Candidatus Peregrinibacteria bacterium RIFOXYC2_FULL_41_22]OGJ54328.1 MAG: hypothetical protein A2336_01335 [Candidatus Peregrinibacteria bacterium RIFOXYB2_FULL